MDSESSNVNPRDNLNNPKRLGPTCLYATYADHYYANLQSKGFVTNKRKRTASRVDDATDDELELDEGYAIADKGQAPAKEVTFSRPRSPKKRKAPYPDVHDAESFAEFARSFQAKEKSARRRAEAEAWRELSLTLRSLARS